MYSDGLKSPTIAKGSLPLSKSASTCDSEGDILAELEQKRRKLDEEITNFRTQKEREFQEFEKDLRERRRMHKSISSAGGKVGQRESLNKPPSRTSSSSALNLLALHAAPKSSPFGNVQKKKSTESPPQRRLTSRTGPSVSQPVVSLDKLNITGETVVPHSGRPRTPPTPTSSSRAGNPSSNSTVTTTSSPKSRRHSSPPPEAPKSPPHPSPDEERHSHLPTGLFTPSYIGLIDTKPGASFQSSSALESPSTEDESATAPSSYKSNNISEVLPLSSSSFPPHVTISPGGHTHASKRAYTAPTVGRIPSALRTASGGALGRKAKHVTFRLADSAIVEPSSSYEEGPSPQFEEEHGSKSPSGTRSPLRTGKSSLNRTLSPDEEDEEAGVKPGMGMGDVIQRLNDYTIAEAAKHGEELVLEVDETNEDEDDDADVPMEMPNHPVNQHEEDDSDRHLTIDYHEHDDENQADEDGYFSPKAKHISTMSSIPRGNSPLTPYRDDNWAELSSSDKDRLLFESRRHSDDSDVARQKKTAKMASPTFDEIGFSGGLKHNVDGGSGVGFFELDEELASPDIKQATSFALEPIADEPEAADGEEEDSDSPGLGISTIGSKKIMDEEKKRWSTDSVSKFGVGSVPIDIVRPSLSVTSSWVGTFGH